MRIVAWNCRRATRDSAVWPYLAGLDPDIALLQEVGSMSKSVLEQWEWRGMPAIGKSGAPQRFQTGILVKGEVGNQLELRGSEDWLAAELKRFSGNIVAYEVKPRSGLTVKAISVYSPAWPASPSRLIGIDTSNVKLKLNRNVWVADLLRASLHSSGYAEYENWTIGGDFNLSETFDSWPGGPRGNREFLDHMEKFGLVECLRASTGQLTPTFRNPKGGKVVHQMDHLFVSRSISARMSRCATASYADIFVAGLSDHVPIIADFR